MKKRIMLFALGAVFLAGVLFIAENIAWAEDDIEKIQDKIENIEEKKAKTEKTLQGSQEMLNRNIIQLNQTQSLIKKTETEISRKEAEIKNLESRMELNKMIFREYLREMYYNDQEEPLIQLAVSKDKLSNIFANTDNMISAKERIFFLLAEISESRLEFSKNKEELANKKEDHEKLLSIKKSEQYEIKSDINEAQATISELNAKLNKLRGELSSLLGNSVSTKNILEAAAFASKITGVRKDFLLGVLVVESNLGRYTGGCNFKESKMSGTRAEIFKDICKELGYDYRKQKVSCPPSGYKGTGGAMGVAQFMPDTWMAYKRSISSVTGYKPPDPWNLTDGVVAMALKLAKVSGVTAHKKSAEAKAYCIYLAGNNWAAYCDNKGTNYGESVLYWANNYEKKL